MTDIAEVAQVVFVQSCGAMSNLEVHHKPFRSHSDHDSEENLITLCVGCHAKMHISSRL